MRTTASLAGGVMVTTSAVCFATTPTLSKLAYEHGADTVGLLIVRFALASVILVGISAIISGQPRATRSHLRVAVVAVLYFLQAYAFFKALALTSATITILLLYLYPLIVMLGSRLFLGEQLTRLRLLVLALGLAGVVFTVGGVEGDLEVGGALLAFSSGVLFAAFIVVTKHFLDDSLPPLEMMGFVYALTCIAYALIGFTTGAHYPTDDAGWFALAGLIVVGTVLAMGLFVLGLSRLPASVASMLSTLEPAVAVGLAAAFLGESVTASQILGVALVLIALLLLTGSLTRDVSVPAHTP